MIPLHGSEKGHTTALGGFAPHMDIVDIVGQSSITDSSGVPLQSDRVPESQGIDFQYHPNAYTDSPSRFPNQQPHPVPVSGLERGRLIEAYPRVRKLLLATRQAYIDQRYAETPDPELTVHDGISILGALQNLPLYTVVRPHNSVPAQGVLPPFLVVSSNAASGGVGALGAVARGRIGLPLPSGREALDATEEEGSLVGQKTVCAAPSRMITGYLDMLKHGSETIAVGDVREETDGFVDVTELSALVSFGAHMEALYEVHRQRGMADHIASTILRKYNPRTQAHSRRQRQAENALRTFRATIQGAVAAYTLGSRSLNLDLGREPVRDGEFYDVFGETNPLGLETVRLALRKNIDIETI